ncbi:MAG: methionyl-tRNA formyltransferase [Pseudomonadota bacterium]
MRLAFMGSPAFATPTLRALVEAGHEIAAVYTQPPRPAGRGGKTRPTAVAESAAELELEVRSPASLKDPAAQAAFAALDLDAAVVVAYGLLLPSVALDAPRLGCFNLHASLLPRWRGAAPIQRAVMAGDAETGVCVMRVTPPLDEGPVLARAATPIGPEEDSGALFVRLAAMGAPLMVESLAALAAGRAVETPQPEEGVTYAKKIDKAEARIDWSRPAETLDRLIRGLSPAPGAWCASPDGARLKVLAARPDRAPSAGAVPGSILDAGLLIACGEGALRLTRVQRAGKAPMDAEDFQRGGGLSPGVRLG